MNKFPLQLLGALRPPAQSLFTVKPLTHGDPVSPQYVQIPCNLCGSVTSKQVKLNARRVGVVPSKYQCNGCSGLQGGLGISSRVLLLSS